MNPRSRGRLGLLYSHKATALAGARGVEPGLFIGPETRVTRLRPKALRATLGHAL